MKIPSSRYLKKKAANRLESGRDPRQVILVYAAVSLLSALVVIAVRFALAEQISHTGGLQNIGLRSMLSTADSILPIVQSLLLMCLEVGFSAAMLRLARHQYVSYRTLKAGFERFWVVLRSRLLMGLIYTGAVVSCFYLALVIFMVTPLSAGFMAQAIPLVESGSYDPTVMLDEAFVMGVLPDMLPMFAVYLIALAVLVLPVFYRLRLVDYILVDHPETGALFALRHSGRLMQGNKLALLRIDLSFWWFWLLQALASLLSMADIILNFFGIALPISATAAYFAALIVYLAAEFTILYFFKNRVSLTYALAYDSLIPRANTEGVVLGNIFQM